MAVGSDDPQRALWSIVCDLNKQKNLTVPITTAISGMIYGEKQQKGLLVDLVV